MKEQYSFEIPIIIFKGKWSGIILWKLKEGNQRIKTLKKEIRDSNEKSIIFHLRELQNYGLVSKSEYGGYPKHTEYYLTDLGKEFVVVLEYLNAFGEGIKDKIIIIDKK